MPRRKWCVVGGLIALLAFVPSAAADEDVTKAIAAIKAVGREGTGNDAAAAAWKSLVAKGAPALFPTLEAIDDANATAANWLRTAAEAIAENEANAKRPLPADKLEAFAANAKFAPSARRLAYELLAKQDPSAKDRLLPQFLNDLSPELRRDAVAAELAKLEKSAKPSIQADLEKLLTFTRDKDQVEAIVKKLEEYKAKVSVSEHFAFVTHWQLIGPFASEEGKALTLSHPPEKAAAATGKFPGKDGTEVAWKPFVGKHRYGLVDLNAAVGKHKNAAVYALAVIVAEKDSPCEIRIGCITALQLHLNGKKLFEREEYHHGMTMDQHVGKGTLRKGANEILIKVCQNEQTDSWAQNWSFQLRVCDRLGTPVALTVVDPKK